MENQPENSPEYIPPQDIDTKTNEAFDRLMRIDQKSNPDYIHTDEETDAMTRYIKESKLEKGMDYVPTPEEMAEVTRPFRQNRSEQSPEHIPTREEVLEIIGRFAENYTIRRELSDEQGVYLIEAVVPTEKAGETIEYGYIRKGTHGKNASAETVIHKTYFDGEMPVGGDNVALYNEVTKAWEDVV